MAETSEHEAIMDELSLRPLRDLGSMPWVRRVTLRTTWTRPGDGMNTIIDVTVERWDNPTRYYWECVVKDPNEPDAMGDDPGIDTLIAYDDPVNAYKSAQAAIGAWLDRERGAA